MRSLPIAAGLLAASAAAIGASFTRASYPYHQQTVREWRFDQEQPDWHAVHTPQTSRPVELTRTSDALRVTLSEGSPGALIGALYVDLPDWRREEWSEVVIRARTTSTVNYVTVGLSAGTPSLPPGTTQPAFETTGGVAPVVRDGAVRTYRVHLDWGDQHIGPWRRLVLQFNAPEPGSIDLLSASVIPRSLEPADGRVIETVLQPSQLKADYALFRKALEEAHAGIYRWTTKRELDAEFVRTEARLTLPMTILEFRSALLHVLGAIKSGHTSIHTYQGDETSTVLNSASLFPLALMFESNRAIVVLNQGFDARVKPGMEVLAINGEPLATILRGMRPQQSQDGDIPTSRTYCLGVARSFHRVRTPGHTGFAEAYRMFIGNPASFRTTLRDPRTHSTVVVDLMGVTNAEAAVNEERNPVNRDVLRGIKVLQSEGETRSIRYLEDESTAILRIPSFRTDNAFLAKTFADLQAKSTRNLIIDLRGNGGGRDGAVPALYSYLAAKEFRVYKKIHVTTIAPSFRRYTDRDFTAATGFPEFSPDSGFLKRDPQGGWLLDERKSGNHTYQPAASAFSGAVYVLMDAGSFSATADFLATAAFHKRAAFIGEESGGTAEGNQSGVLIGLTLPESQLHIGIPIYEYVNAVDGFEHARGTMPTFAVAQTIDDLVDARDTPLAFARALIRAGKR